MIINNKNINVKHIFEKIKEIEFIKESKKEILYDILLNWLRLNDYESDTELKKDILKNLNNASRFFEEETKNCFSDLSSNIVKRIKQKPVSYIVPISEIKESFEKIKSSNKDLFEKIILFEIILRWIYEDHENDKSDLKLDIEKELIFTVLEINDLVTL